MSVRIHYFTDPADAASWAAQPSLRRLLWEFGADVPITYVMGGLARDFEGRGLLSEWLDMADQSGMPVDPRLWTESPIRSTYPACIAVKAAAEQGPRAQERYLRAVMEGLFCFRRKLDAPEALIDVAREAGLDVERFRIDVVSNAAVEAFGADLDRVRAPGHVFGGDDSIAEPVALPSVLAQSADGTSGRWLRGDLPYEDWREEVIAVGAAPPAAPPPSITAALDRFGRMATVEIAAVCELPGPRAAAELWRLAAEWQVKPTRVLTGWLWERA